MSNRASFDLMKCAITVDYCGESNKSKSVEFYTFPEEINSSLAAMWSEQTILGRVGAIAAFAYTQNKTTSFSLPLHREMTVGGSPYSNTVTKIMSAESTVQRLQADSKGHTAENSSTEYGGMSVVYAVGYLLNAACMPIYTAGGALKPPITTFKFGNHIFRGRVTSVGERWSGPMIDGYYSMCEYSISMTETQLNSEKLASAENVPLNWYQQNA